MTQHLRTSLLVSTLVFAFPLSIQAQEGAMDLARLIGPVVLDGTPDEAAWQAIPPLPLTMYTPVFRGTPTQRTEIRAAYDDEHLYVAGWVYDTDPSGIRIHSL